MKINLRVNYDQFGISKKFVLIGIIIVLSLLLFETQEVLKFCIGVVVISLILCLGVYVPSLLCVEICRTLINLTREYRSLISEYVKLKNITTATKEGKHNG